MMTDMEKVVVEIEDALSGNLAKAGHVYKLSLNGLKDKALTDALTLLKEQEERIRDLKDMFKIFIGSVKWND